MEKLIKKFKEHVIKESKNLNFIHHKWYVKYHLEIVEKISLELCKKYPKADKNLVLLLVWLHDYGKIIDFKNQHKTTLTKGKKKLKEFSFPKHTIEKASSYVKMIDNKIGLKKATIEVKIVSSADGASHLIGPFYPIYWYENHKKAIENIMKENIRKASKDWKEKIVLPEVKKMFKKRHDFLIENSGKIPSKFLKI